MTALITGISGFIAGNLAKALAWDGVEVVGTGRRPSEFAADACRFVPLDVTDFDACKTVMATEKPEIVYHLAANAVLSAVLKQGPMGMIQTNATGTLNLLEACRLADVPTMVVASSDKQYGALASPPYDDEDTTAFQNGGVYELSKAQQDQIARLYAGLYEVPAVRIARIVNVYGPGDTQWTRIVPGTIRRTVQGERARVTAGPAGAALREYLFVDDCVAALRYLAADASQRGNQPLRRTDGKLARVAYNLPTGERYPAGQVIATIQQVLRNEFGIVGPEPEELPGPTGVFEPGHQFVKPDRFRILNPDWSPRTMVEGLLATIPWYLQQLRMDTFGH